MRVPFAVLVPLVVVLPDPTAAQTPACGGRRYADRIEVTEREARCPWPFWADRVVIRCVSVGNNRGLYVVVDGRPYALNGNARDLARSRGIGIDDYPALMRPGGGHEGPWIRAALPLCEPLPQ